MLIPNIGPVVSIVALIYVHSPLSIIRSSAETKTCTTIGHDESQMIILDLVRVFVAPNDDEGKDDKGKNGFKLDRRGWQRSFYFK